MRFLLRNVWNSLSQHSEFVEESFCLQYHTWKMLGSQQMQDRKIYSSLKDTVFLVAMGCHRNVRDALKSSVLNIASSSG